MLERQYSLLKTTGVGLGLEGAGRGWKGLEGAGRGWKGLEGAGRGWKGLEGAGLGSTLASYFPHNYTHKLEELQAVTCWYYT